MIKRLKLLPGTHAKVHYLITNLDGMTTSLWRNISGTCIFLETHTGENINSLMGLLAVIFFVGVSSHVLLTFAMLECFTTFVIKTVLWF